MSQNLYSGATLQAGLAPASAMHARANGLLLRGVVVATYVPDDPASPYATPQTTPSAVYCDVLAYSTAGAAQINLLPKVLVSQNCASIQGGDVWMPRAATLDVSGKSLSITPESLMRLDGDHVIIGFLGNSLSQPVILRSLPHPQADIGQGGAEPSLGQTVRLKRVDGDPRLIKHHGSVLGISQAGDIVAKTLYANTGETTALGAPPPPPTDGSVGNMLLQLHGRAQRLTQMLDMDNPVSPKEVLRELLEATKWQLTFTEQTAHMLVSDAGGRALEVKGSDTRASMVLGSGVKSATIAEYLEAMWNKFEIIFNSHSHGSAFGPTAESQLSGFSAPKWDNKIKSTHMKIPDEG